MTQTPAPYARIPFVPEDPNASPNGPKVGFGKAISLAFKNYVNFEGFSGRGEYWWFTLFVVLVSLGINVLEIMAGTAGGQASLAILGVLWSLATVLPQLAVAVRRLRDAGHHWASLFLALIPLVGAIILIVFLASPSRPRTR